MHPTAILFPVFALAAWTGLILLLIPFKRVRAVRRGIVTEADFELGESPAVPRDVSMPNQNYMNLLEAPVLFYIACLVLHAGGTVTAGAVALGWSYVALRMMHSLIHLGYNNVQHRLLAFAASNAVLVALWVDAGRAIFTASA